MSEEFFVHLFHIIIVGGLFMYVGIIKEKMFAFVYPLLLVLGVIIIFYHMYKAYKYNKQGKSYWVSLIHILLVGPLLHRPKRKMRQNYIKNNLFNLI